MNTCANIRLLAALLCLVCLSVAFTTENRQAALNEEANKLMEQGRLDEALALYSKALNLEADGEPVVHSNMGSVFYKKQDFANALAEYAASLQTAEQEQLKSDILFNMGDAYFRQGDYEKASQAFLESLVLNPQDADTRYNLELSQKELRKQQQEQNKQDQQDDKQQDQDKQEQQDQSKQEDKQDQQQQDQQEQQQQEQQQEQQQQQQQDQQDKQQPDKQEQVPLEQMKRLLQSINQDDKEAQKEKVQLQIQKQNKDKGDVDKDW